MPNTFGSCAAERLYSNRVGKGTHAAVARLATFMRAVSGHGSGPGWFLQLALKPDRTPRRVTDGAAFLGYIVRPDYRLVRCRIIGNLRVKLATFARDQVTATALRLPPGPQERLRAELASYLGHFGHADAWHLGHSQFVRDSWLGLIFRLREGRLVPRWEPSDATSLRVLRYLLTGTAPVTPQQ